MIIVSQNKKIITERMELSIEDSKQIMVESAKGPLYVLGIYETEERAKEVLKEIIEAYKKTNYEYENCWCLRNIVYEMPKE